MLLVFVLMLLLVLVLVIEISEKFYFNTNPINTSPPSYFEPLLYSAIMKFEEVHMPLTL